MSSPVLPNPTKIALYAAQSGVASPTDTAVVTEATGQIVFRGCVVSLASWSLGDALSGVAQMFKDTQPESLQYHQLPALFKPVVHAGP